MSEFEAAQVCSNPPNSVHNESIPSSLENLSLSKEFEVPTGIKSVKEVAKWLGVLDGTLTLAATNMLLKAKPIVEKDYFVDTPLRKERSSSQSNRWCSDHPFYAKVSTAKWLTKTSATEDTFHSWSDDKQVIHLELSLEGSDIHYVPGDSMGICCPNPDYVVQIVLKVLQKAHPNRTLTLDSHISCINFPSLYTLGELLRYGMDLVGTPKKAAVAVLAQCCQNPEEAVMMQNLCSKSNIGKQLWSSFVEAQNIGLGELLYLFPSCTPTLAALLQCVSALPPRYYSIASSPLRDPLKVSLAFSVVRSVCKLGVKSAEDGAEAPEIRRNGVCTHYLLHLLKPWLLSGSTNHHMPELYVRTFHKPSTCFQLPGSVHYPLILIGPGTGVAPFMGFLDHRALLEYDRKRAGGEDISTGLWRGGFELEEDDLPCECNKVEQFIHNVTPGPIHLFFGCRNDNDYLYRTALEKHVSSGTLTTLDVAQSRMSDQKVYVTHRIEARGKELTRLILNEGAYIYVCGDGNQMAKDVFCSFKNALMSHSCHRTEEEAEKLLADLKQRRRYVLDIWS